MSALLDFNNDKMPLYMKVYSYYKELIVNSKLAPASKLPSVRRCSEELSVSRTTVESAYLQLAADGYIISKPQSGYYVTDIAVYQKKAATDKNTKEIKPKIFLDFSTVKADKESFDFNLWRRYLKSALRQDERLLSYGLPQGEVELREVIAKYISQSRNVVCNKESIVIGAGVQSLLHILCGLIESDKQIAFEDKAFYQGIAIFSDHGFKIVDDKNNTDVLYISPSHINKWGDVMPSSQRIELIRNCEKNDILLIEDDYDNEFGYFNHPMPSLQGLDAGRNVIYLGSFSKLLLPSIRISFMILPDSLIEKYKLKSSLYNQTVSTIEQIALCQFIRDGHLSRRIKKVKKIYTQNTIQLNKAIKQVFGEKAKTSIGETGFVIRMELNTALSAEEIASSALKKGIMVVAENGINGKPQLLLSCSSVNSQNYINSMQILYNCIYND